jgi:hypothetical protein
MDSTPAEDLPALYRAILDAVADLEAMDERPLAARIRRNATAAYSRAWDERARRRLQLLLRDAGQPADVRRDRERQPRDVTTAIAPAVVAQDG